MKELNIENISHIHFIGVGGIGMSALARHFLAEKKTVSGSDGTLTPLTKTLDAEGIQVFGEQVASNITKDIELIIYTEAMPKGHDEMKAAKKLGVPMVNYFEALGIAMNPYYLIAIAGTHGKTTTGAMLTDIFEASEKDPTSIIGSLRAKTGSNYRGGKSKYAIVEACEYKRDFLHLKPDVLVITNLEHEHVDCYASLEEVQDAFKDLAAQVNEGGVVIVNEREPNIAPVIEGLSVPVLNYMRELDLDLVLKQPGLHNRLNAAAAATVAKHEGLDAEATHDALADFSGTWRRFEYKGEVKGAPVYDDYAHHPTEIRATIDAARELYPERRLVIAFQPHTYSRTKVLFDEFAKAVGLADSVILLPVYAAREENISGITSRELAVRSLEFAPESQYVDSSAKAEKILRKTLTNEDVLVIMGAGDVGDLATAIVK
ncbi:MAG: UDP-N-acetylmuramate--L-alanine ligase [Candidatus Pacebacteria bacterium]|nr:UDP-N-acetylmuramate--L-alanine ligase [Candidatus Paceibacterota bacterium]